MNNEPRTVSVNDLVNLVDALSTNEVAALKEMCDYRLRHNKEDWRRWAGHKDAKYQPLT